MQKKKRKKEKKWHKIKSKTVYLYGMRAGTRRPKVAFVWPWLGCGRLVTQRVHLSGHVCKWPWPRLVSWFGGYQKVWSSQKTCTHRIWIMRIHCMWHNNFSKMFAVIITCLILSSQRKTVKGKEASLSTLSILLALRGLARNTRNKGMGEGRIRQSFSWFLFVDSPPSPPLLPMDSLSLPASFFLYTAYHMQGGA